MYLFIEIIIIMEICKAPTLRLKALNKHTHIMYIEMENVIKTKTKQKHTHQKTKKTSLKKRVYIDKCSSILHFTPMVAVVVMSGTEIPDGGGRGRLYLTLSLFYTATARMTPCIKTALRQH